MPERKNCKKALSGFIMCSMKKGITQCRGRGVFRKNKITPKTTGRRQVVFQADNPSEGYVLEVFDRKNETCQASYC